MISSTKNEQVKAVIELKKKAKAREEQGLFVVEGVRMFSELQRDRVERVYASESFLEDEKNRELLQEICGPDGGKSPGNCREMESFGRTGAAVKLEVVSDSVFSVMSDTQTPQGVLALVRQYEYTVEELTDGFGAAHLMLLENIQDPGNLGTILRAGEGAGITGLIMSRDTVDIYNPKVIRSTMGSVFRVPFLYVEDLVETARMLKKSGIRLYAAHLQGRNNYEQEDYTGNTGFLIGNEGNGLSDVLSLEADAWIKIPMAGKVESLNAAVAASILMFETARQRRAVSDR